MSAFAHGIASRPRLLCNRRALLRQGQTSRCNADRDRLRHCLTVPLMLHRFGMDEGGRAAKASGVSFATIASGGRPYGPLSLVPLWHRGTASVTSELGPSVAALQSLRWVNKGDRRKSACTGGLCMCGQLDFPFCHSREALSEEPVRNQCDAMGPGSDGCETQWRTEIHRLVIARKRRMKSPSTVSSHLH